MTLQNLPTSLWGLAYSRRGHLKMPNISFKNAENGSNTLQQACFEGHSESQPVVAAMKGSKYHRQLMFTQCLHAVKIRKGYILLGFACWLEPDPSHVFLTHSTFLRHTASHTHYDPRHLTSDTAHCCLSHMLYVSKNRFAEGTSKSPIANP